MNLPFNVIPDVEQVIATNNYELIIYFHTGHIKIYDCKWILNMSDDTVFAPLKDFNTFVNSLTVLNNTVAWTIDGSYSSRTCVDLDSLVLFNEGKDIKENEFIGKYDFQKGIIVF
jgi:hypothetical protein